MTDDVTKGEPPVFCKHCESERDPGDEAPCCDGYENDLLREKIKWVVKEKKRLQQKAKASPGGATLNLKPLYDAIDDLEKA